MGIFWILFQAKNERNIQTEAKMEGVILRSYSEPSSLTSKWWAALENWKPFPNSKNPVRPLAIKLIFILNLFISDKKILYFRSIHMASGNL